MHWEFKVIFSHFVSPLDDFGLYISKGHNETGKLFFKIKIQKIQKFDILNRYGNWVLIGICFLHIRVNQRYLRHTESHPNTSRSYQVQLLLFMTFSVSRAEVLVWGQSILYKKHGKQTHVIHNHVTAFITPR